MPSFIAATSTDQIDAAVRELAQAAERLATLSLTERIEITERSIPTVAATAREWVEAACQAKQIPVDSPARAEEVLAGPISVLRQLRLLAGTFAAIRHRGRPVLPGRVVSSQGRLRVPVFPTGAMWDGLLFYPIKAETWLAAGVQQNNVFAPSVARLAGDQTAPARVCAVLGAGNVSAIPATDALTKILQESQAVLLKMNPVNEYLGSILQQALAPMIEVGFLRIVYGGADVGSRVVHHPGVDEVHLTGSIETHDAIVWGPDTEERQQRRLANQPALDKPVTSELGNVSPWIVVPGRYSDSELRYQATNVAASIVNNASFNCIATKVIVTCRSWPDRQRFLELVEVFLRDTPRRYAYYPGALERYVQFAGHEPAAEDTQHLPWMLRRDADPDNDPHLFQQESFVCVCAETSLEASSGEEFLQRAVAFANDQLWGTLAAALSVPRELQKATGAARLDQAIADLRYGTVGVNQWPGLAYALMSPPWGGFPCGDLHDAQSGGGMVHNSFLLDRPEKTVLRSPLRTFPKPVWFPTHRAPEAVAWKLLELYRQPSLVKLPMLFAKALGG